MREILFRGKRICDDEWIEGCFGRYYNGESDVACISIPSKGFFGYSSYEIDPETVGQYSGLTDKNGVKIFEGDILRIGLEEDDYIVCQVYEYRGVMCVDYETPDWDFNALGFLDNDNVFIFEIIGNIYDNPELIGGDE